MKRQIIGKICLIIIAVTVALSFVGCDKVFSEVGKTDAPTVSKKEELPQEKEPSKTQASEKKVSFEVGTIDRSYRNEEGTVLIEHSYDLVTVRGKSASDEKINSVLKEDMEAFLWSEEELQSYVGEWLDFEYPYKNTVTAEVTHNSDNLFSVVLTRAWYMGGVFNVDDYCYVFDIKTGELATLDKITGKSFDELGDKLKKTVFEYLSKEGMAGYIDDEYIHNYEPAAFRFCIKKGEIVLLFSNYELSPETIMVPTGMMVGQ